MIVYLSTRDHQYTIRWRLMQDFDVDPATRRELFQRLRLLSYEKAFRLRSFPAATYVFADLERLTPEETERAAIVWRTLAESGRGMRLLNHPIRSMRRFELLRHLYEQGINDFNVRRLTDPRPMRFPVFIRSESDHTGSATPLLHSPAELDAAIERLVAAGKNRDDKIVVEFCDTTDADGIYHRYGAHVVGSRIFASNLFFDSHWVVKHPNMAATTPARAAAERRYVATNPHEATLGPICRLTRIDYGRIDYAVVNGKIQVFEINTNPTAPSGAHLLIAAREIDLELDPGSPIPVKARYEPPWKEELSWAHWVSRGIHVALRELDLLHLEPPTQATLRRAKRGALGLLNGRRFRWKVKHGDVVESSRPPERTA